MTRPFDVIQVRDKFLVAALGLLAARIRGRRQDGLTTAEREELVKLRRENRRLREEQEILAKAAAWFARETGSIPPKSSSS